MHDSPELFFLLAIRANLECPEYVFDLVARLLLDRSFSTANVLMALQYLHRHVCV